MADRPAPELTLDLANDRKSAMGRIARRGRSGGRL